MMKLQHKSIDLRLLQFKQRLYGSDEHIKIVPWNAVKTICSCEMLDKLKFLKNVRFARFCQ